MNTPASGDTLVNTGQLVDFEMLDEFYVEMSELIDQLHDEVSEFTPNFYHSYFFLRSNATKIFQKFIEDIRSTVVKAKAMDTYVQGTLFDV